MTSVNATTGCELELFAGARRWKAYFGSLLAPFISGDVCEVGAGRGETTGSLINPAVRSWTMIEPEASLFEAADANLTALGAKHPAVRWQLEAATLAALDRDSTFDTIVYVDVLEHIVDDAAELAEASSRLRPGGRIVSISPAHRWLMSEFDRAIGHHRRYSARVLRDLTPPGLEVEASWYLDSVGLVLSGANRFLLRQSMPTERQIGVWDRRVVPMSRVVDRLAGRRLGKSVVAVWRRPLRSETVGVA